MKALNKITTTLSILALSATPAFASQQAESSSLLVWLFIGFCGLVVVSQLIPALVLGLAGKGDQHRTRR